MVPAAALQCLQKCPMKWAPLSGVKLRACMGYSRDHPPLNFKTVSAGRSHLEQLCLQFPFRYRQLLCRQAAIEMADWACSCMALSTAAIRGMSPGGISRCFKSAMLHHSTSCPSFPMTWPFHRVHTANVCTHMPQGLTPNLSAHDVIDSSLICIICQPEQRGTHGRVTYITS